MSTCRSCCRPPVTHPSPPSAHSGFDGLCKKCFSSTKLNKIKHLYSQAHTHTCCIARGTFILELQTLIADFYQQLLKKQFYTFSNFWWLHIDFTILPLKYSFPIEEGNFQRHPHPTSVGNARCSINRVCNCNLQYPSFRPSWTIFFSIFW